MSQRHGAWKKRVVALCVAIAWISLTVTVSAATVAQAESTRDSAANGDRVVGTRLQALDAGMVTVSTAGEFSSASYSSNPVNALNNKTQDPPPADRVSLPGSVIALVVALIAVVAVARRDVSGTTHNS